MLSGKAWLAGLTFFVLAVLAMSGHASPLNIDLPPEHCDGQSPYAATLHWDLGEDFDGRTEIRVGSPSGNLFTSGRESGEATTGRWVRPGMRFVLVNAADQSILGEAEASMDVCGDEGDETSEVTAEPVPDPPQRDDRSRSEAAMPSPPSTPGTRPPAILEPLGRIDLDEDEFLKLSPPRLRFCGQPVESAMVRVLWDVSGLGEERARIYLDSPGGRVFADGPVRGEKITGEWVTHGMRFLLYLPDRDEVIAERQFRILPCNVADYPDEPAEDD